MHSGIYGRAVVVGSQTQYVMSAVVLVSEGCSTPHNLPYWTITIFCVLWAVLFSVLMFGRGVTSRTSS